MDKNMPANRQHELWTAVLALALTVASLITAELLPISLLTPMATDLGISESATGQTVTITAIVAMISSLLIPACTNRTDRRTLLLVLTGLLIVSNLIVAIAPNIFWLLFGRLILGISLGGFWAMSNAITMRLVPINKIAKALSIIFSGVTLATIVATPLGSYLAAILNWRDVFYISAILSISAWALQYSTLPSLPTQQQANMAELIKLLKNKKIYFGVISIILMCGHYAFLTYLRPFLESLPYIDIEEISALLLVFGIGNLAGTLVSGYLLNRHIQWIMSSLFLLIIAISFHLLVENNSFYLVMFDLFLWGIAISIIVVGWSTWLTKTIPKQTELGGGMLVAAYQISITIGASLGGVCFEFWNSHGVLIFTFITTFFSFIFCFKSTQTKNHLN